ncbi:hypothetical protein GCM10020255_019840 [Rhodococcus baikonurensis]
MARFVHSYSGKDREACAIAAVTKVDLVRIIRGRECLRCVDGDGGGRVRVRAGRAPACQFWGCGDSDNGHQIPAGGDLVDEPTHSHGELTPRVGCEGLYFVVHRQGGGCIHDVLPLW